MCSVRCRRPHAAVPTRRRATSRCALLAHDERAQLLVRTLWPALWGANLQGHLGRGFRRSRRGAPARRVGGTLSAAGRSAAADPHRRSTLRRASRDIARALGRGGRRRRRRAGARRRICRRRERCGRALARNAGTIAGADAEKVLQLLERLPVTLHLTQTAQVPLEVMQLAMSATDLARGRARLVAQAGGGAAHAARRRARARVRAVRQPERHHAAAGRAARSPLGRARLDAAPTAARSSRARCTGSRRRSSRMLGQQRVRDPAARAAGEPAVPTDRAFGDRRGERSRAHRQRRTRPGQRRRRTARRDRFDAGASPGQLGGTPAGGLFETLWRVARSAGRRGSRACSSARSSRRSTPRAIASIRGSPASHGAGCRRAPYFSERRRLGAYGWVDRPFTGTRGPTRAGLLLAPSVTQARAAVILRDKAVYDPAPAAGALPGTRRWDMSIDSARARLAQRLAAEVRIGAPLAEVLGREVERIVAAKDVDRRPAPALHAAQREPGTPGVRRRAGDRAHARADHGGHRHRACARTRKRGSPNCAKRSTCTATCSSRTRCSTSCPAAAIPPARRWKRPRVSTCRRRSTCCARRVRATARRRSCSRRFRIATRRRRSTACRRSCSRSRRSPRTSTRHSPRPAQWTWTREDRVRAADGTFTHGHAPTSRWPISGSEVIDLVVLRPEQVAGLVLAQTEAARRERAAARAHRRHRATPARASAATRRRR